MQFAAYFFKCGRQSKSEAERINEFSSHFINKICKQEKKSCCGKPSIHNFFPIQFTHFTHYGCEINQCLKSCFLYLWTPTTVELKLFWGIINCIKYMFKILALIFYFLLLLNFWPIYLRVFLRLSYDHCRGFRG